jgi:hypothetical protein
VDKIGQEPRGAPEAGGQEIVTPASRMWVLGLLGGTVLGVDSRVGGIARVAGRGSGGG